MFGKLSHIDHSSHHIDLINMVLLISLLESDRVNVDLLSESALIPCLNINGTLFVALKIEIQENGDKDLVAISHYVTPSILRDLVSSFLSTLSEE